MIDPERDEPTIDEIAAAEAVMNRVAVANASKVAAALPDIRALVADVPYAQLLEAGAAIRERLPPGTPFHTHLGAMIVGMTNLRNDAAIA